MSSKSFINIKNKFDRVIVLVDMDCFYCQVEEKLNPEIKGKPIAVVQYNPWQGGGIIAVNYPARAKGVTRHMRGDEAKAKCPEIELPQVPQVRGKADISKYRDAGKEVAEVLKSFSPLLERASVDEAYLDITERVLGRLREMNEGKFQLLPDKLVNTFAVGFDSIGEFVQRLSNNFDGSSASQDTTAEQFLEYKKSDIKLLVGASIVNEIRAAVKEKTGYECSAGIAHNKILAKLTAGFHKPNKQTLLPLQSITGMYDTLPLKKVKGLGGKLGDQVCEVLKIKFMSELLQFPEKVLQQHFDERMGSWMYLMARGIDLEAVTSKFHSKSIGCCKRFPGKNAITGLATLTHWLNELALEIVERLEKDLDENDRTAKLLTVSYCQQLAGNDVSSTRSVPLVSYEADRIASDSLDAIKRNTEIFFRSDSTSALNNAIKFLGISAGKFESNERGKGGLKEMFQTLTAKASSSSTSSNVTQPNETQVMSSVSKEPLTFKTKINGKKQTDSIQQFFKRTPENSGQSTLKVQTAITATVTEEIHEDIKRETAEPRGIESAGHEMVSADPMVEKTQDLEVENEPIAIEPIKQEKDIQEDKPGGQPISVSNDTGIEVEGKQNYKQTYAEYNYQPSAPAVNVVECPECGKQISINESDSHQDFHLALKLSQQQREEYRSAFSKRFTTPTTQQQSKLSISAAKKPKNIAPITRFLSKPANGSVVAVATMATSTSDAVVPSSSDKNGGLERCEECGKLVESMAEHLDYHVAKKLQAELNRQDAPASSAPVSKRPRVSANEVRTPAKAKLKPVSSYFTKIE